MGITAKLKAIHPAYRNAFLLFALVILAGYWLGEASLDPVVNKTRYFIRATMTLFLPAYVLTMFRSHRPWIATQSDAFWIFSGAAYFIHFYWAVFRHYGGFAETVAGQGPLIAYGNFLLTAWWLFDLTWLGHSKLSWKGRARFIFQSIVFLVMLITALSRSGSSVRYVAYAMILIVGSAIALRCIGHVKQEAAPAENG